MQGLPAERAVVGRVAMAKEVGSETTARAGAARVAARTATEAAATVAVATAVGTRTATTATTAATTAREAAANGTPVMALGRVAVAAAEAVTVAAEKAVTVREVQLGLVGESWILELSKNERDGRLPRLSVDAGGSHGVRRAPASSRGGMATRQGRHRRGSPRNPSSRESEARKLRIEGSFWGTECAGNPRERARGDPRRTSRR